MVIAIVILAVIAVFILFTRRSSKGIVQANAEIARSMSLAPDTIILDVRTGPEFHEGHLKRALHIPVTELASRLGELAGEKERQLLVYCRSGGRSSAACGILAQNGFSRIVNLHGGIESWRGSGYPIER